MIALPKWTIASSSKEMTVAGMLVSGLRVLIVNSRELLPDKLRSSDSHIRVPCEFKSCFMMVSLHIAMFYTHLEVWCQEIVCSRGSK